MRKLLPRRVHVAVLVVADTWAISVPSHMTDVGAIMSQARESVGE